MQGKLANTVFLTREKEHVYPSLVFANPDFFEEIPSIEINSDYSSKYSCQDNNLEMLNAEEVKNNDVVLMTSASVEIPTASTKETLITKWIKDNNG